MKSTDEYIRSSYGYKLIAAEAMLICGKIKEASLNNENRIFNNLLNDISRSSKKKLVYEIIEHMKTVSINNKRFSKIYKQKYYINPVIVPKDIKNIVSKKLKQVRKLVRIAIVKCDQPRY